MDAAALRLDNYVDINIDKSMSNQKPLSFATTLLVRDRCLCLHVQRAARVLARRFDDALRPLDLTNGQFSLLMSLNRPEPPNMAQISAVLAMDRTTLTAALKPLERRGLITITPDERDRRHRRVGLTDAGLEILARALPIWTATHDEIDRVFPASDPQRLRDDLNRIV